MGGSADLTPSVKTKAKGMEDFQKTTADAKYVHYGIREHGMVAAMNGMALHGGVRPYGGTFLIFSDYAKPAIRLGALMGAPVVYVFTHDSVGLGEDGPTHQPVEQLAGLRAIPASTSSARRTPTRRRRRGSWPSRRPITRPPSPSADSRSPRSRTRRRRPSRASRVAATSSRTRTATPT